MAEDRLTTLPADTLHIVWSKLEDTEHQHALRSTCTAARDVSTSWITSLHLSLAPIYEVSSWIQVKRAAMDMLARFPHQASLRRLHWSYWDDRDGMHDVSLPGLLPGVLVRGAAAGRLGAVEHAKLEGETITGYGELAALSAACPRLRSLSITSTRVVGPALAALVALSGLRELELCDMRTDGYDDDEDHDDGEDHDVVVESLASLTSLTRLEIWHRDSGATELCLDSLLPHLAGLRSLAHLSLIGLRRDFGGDPGAPCGVLSHLGGLTALTCLDLDIGWTRGNDIAFLSAATRLCDLTLKDSMRSTTPGFAFSPPVSRPWSVWM